jgi:hypothetical protein
MHSNAARSEPSNASSARSMRSDAWKIGVSSGHFVEAGPQLPHSGTRTEFSEDKMVIVGVGQPGGGLNFNESFASGLVLYTGSGMWPYEAGSLINSLYVTASHHGSYPFVSAQSGHSALGYAYIDSNGVVSFPHNVGEPFDVTRSIQEVHHALDQDPIVDGFDHPGEFILNRAFASDPESVAQWFQNYITTEPASSRVADILRLLGRFTPYTPAWRREIVAAALSSPSVEVRDAATQAVESWAESELTALLRSHVESTPWLAAYAAQVVRDLEG